MALKNLDGTKQTNEAPRQTIEFGSKPLAVTVDYDFYARFLEDADLTEDQKREFLQSLWNVIVEFVSLGFGVHPAQQAQINCGEPTNSAAESAPQILNGIGYSGSPVVDEFGNAVGSTSGAGKEVG